jgi:hypothetical protein
VSGFGQDVWPVDVRTDLAVFLEQLPDAPRAIKERKWAEMNFYEQGVERSVAFEPDGATYRATCKSWATTWQAHPAIEEISADSLEQMLLAVRDEFMRVQTMMLPAWRIIPGYESGYVMGSDQYRCPMLLRPDDL